MYASISGARTLRSMLLFKLCLSSQTKSPKTPKIKSFDFIYICCSSYMK
jgi:hypothetical protein